MTPTSHPDEDLRDRAMAAAAITGLALEQDLPHMALGAAREAARAALLALAPLPRRPFGADLDLLRGMAAAPAQRLAGRPAERLALIHATLAAVDRLFPPPGAAALPQAPPARRGWS